MSGLLRLVEHYHIESSDTANLSMPEHLYP